MDDYLSKGLSSVLRRLGQQRRAGDDVPPRDAPDEPAEDLPQELGGHPVFELIGRGGMGLVYRGGDPELGRTLAIKVLAKRHAGDPELVQRFRREASICSRLQHPGVVPVYGRGELADGRPYFTMKVVDGETLAELLRRDGRDPAVRERHLGIFAKICQTLAYVHASHVVHGDLKPGNVMVGAFGEIQVMDWGFAREIEGEPVRRSGHILGTPAYMAPEQARGDAEKIGPRTDVFGLGAILCEVLTGEPPYIGEDRDAVYLAASRGWNQSAFERLEACGADPALVALARRCLAADPDARPADANFVEAEVTGHLESVALRAHEAGQAALAASVRAEQERRSRRVVTALGAALLAAVASVAALLLWQQRERTRHEADTRGAVEAALDRALRLHGRAAQQPPEQVLYWDEALAAAMQASDFATAAGATAADVERVARIVADVRRDRDAALAMRELRNWLEEIRPHMGDDRGCEGIEADYAAVFARHGFDLRGQAPVDVARQMAASPLLPSLVRALEDWAFAHHREHPEQGGEWQRLLTIAALADPDGWRDRVRLAFTHGDADQLVALARELDLRTSPAQTINLLGRMLVGHGRNDEAVRLLRDALTWHPQDFWILHDLARALDDVVPPPRPEILGLRLAGTSVRPGSAHAWTDYAYALKTSGQPQRALDALERATTLDPDYARAWRFRAWIQRDLGDFEAARAAAARAIGCAEHFQARSLLADALRGLGRHTEALEQARLAVAARPDEFQTQFSLGQSLAELEVWPEAEAALRRASELAPESAAPHRALTYVLTRTDRHEAAAAAARVAYDMLAEAGQHDQLPAADYHRNATARRAAVAARMKNGDPMAWADPQELAWCAEVAWMRGEFGKAFAWFRAIHAIDPGNLAGHRYCAIVTAARIATDQGQDATVADREAASRCAMAWMAEELAAARRLARIGQRDPAQLSEWVTRLLENPLMKTLWDRDGESRQLRRDVEDFLGEMRKK